MAGLLAEGEAQRLITWVWRARSSHERLLWRDTQLAAEMIGDSGRHPHAGLLSFLRNALKNESWWVRRAAAEALGKIDNPQAFPILLKALQEDHSAMISALLRMSLAEVEQILQERLRPRLKSLPLPLLILLGVVIAALVALLILKRGWGQ